MEGKSIPLSKVTLAIRRGGIPLTGGFDTKLIHVAEKPDPVMGSVIPPIYTSATFAFPDNRSLDRYMENGGPGFLYTRYGNPNTTMAEAKIAALEGAEAALVLASGTAATFVAITALARTGDHVVCQRGTYGGSFSLLHQVLPRFGIETTFVNLHDIAQVEASIRDNTRVLFVETPSNPTLAIADISALSERAHAMGVKVIVDNTLATPYNQRPLHLGADGVIHSGTKYLNGHSDVISGAIAGDHAYIETCLDLARKTGGTINGFDSWLLVRGLKTLGLRMERHNSNAQAIAEFLASHPKIARVYYPGLPDHPGHELAKRQMPRGYGGVLSIDLKGGQDDVDALIDRVAIFTRAVSLGSVESLITQPVVCVHRSVPEEEKRLAGITRSLVRLSVGIENPEDLMEDLERALS